MALVEKSCTAGGMRCRRTTTEISSRELRDPWQTVGSMICPAIPPSLYTRCHTTFIPTTAQTL